MVMKTPEQLSQWEGMRDGTAEVTWWLYLHLTGESVFCSENCFSNKKHLNIRPHCFAMA